MIPEYAGLAWRLVWAMITKSYKIADIKLGIGDLGAVLLLSCILKEGMFYGWKLRLPVKGVASVELRLWTSGLPALKKPDNDLKYLTDRFRELKGKVSQNCNNYQKWKTILDTKGSAFFEEGKECIAIRGAALEKLTPSQRFFTVSAERFARVFVHNEIDYFRRLGEESSYTTIDRKIIPLVKAVNLLPNTATTSSCHGKYNLPGFGFTPFNARPFVCFITNIETVVKIQNIIEAEKPGMRFTWGLTGHVENECPSLGPYIHWKLSIKERLSVFNAHCLESDIECFTRAFAVHA